MSTTTNTKENPDITTNPSPEDTGSQLGENYMARSENGSAVTERSGVSS